MPFDYIYFPEWDLLNIAVTNCKSRILPAFDVINVKSFEDCTKKSDTYEYVHFLERKEDSEEFKCFRHQRCNTFHGDFLNAVNPGSAYGKFSVYFLDYCLN